jgi:regulator of cell morphogenesis and NO signaling
MIVNQRQTVGEIAAASPGAARVFENHGIDYCCGGNRPLEDVCREKGLDSGTLLAELAQATGTAGSQEKDWSAAPLRELIRHILTTHHQYLNQELPRLNQRLKQVIAAHGQDAATLLPLAEVFGGLREELEGHMRKEELILFPAIERCEAALAAGASLPPAPFGSVENPIRVMELEHENAGQALRRIKELTHGYQVPGHACATYRALWEGLQGLEADLHLHIHLENNILFPRAIAREQPNR